MFQSTLQFSSIFGGTLKNIKIKLGMTGPNVIFVKRTLMVRAVVEQHTSGIISKAAKKKTSGGGGAGAGAGGGEAAGNLTNLIAMIENHVILDQQLNHFCWRNMKFCFMIMIVVGQI
ncbi:hypothetical protein ACOSQ2_022269 [Xanthoceras sorbifolium]